MGDELCSVCEEYIAEWFCKKCARNICQVRHLLAMARLQPRRVGSAPGWNGRADSTDGGQPRTSLPSLSHLAKGPVWSQLHADALLTCLCDASRRCAGVRRGHPLDSGQEGPPARETAGRARAAACTPSSLTKPPCRCRLPGPLRRRGRRGPRCRLHAVARWGREGRRVGEEERGGSRAAAAIGQHYSPVWQQ